MSLSRRSFLATALAATTLPTLGVAAAHASSERPDGMHVTPEQALQWMKEGNRRWVMREPQQVNHAPQVPKAKGQWPFAAVLGCSDSRATPDAIFDVATSNLFVVRNAGNVVDPEGLGSLEYAVEHLGISAIMVLGHERCGAVGATEEYLKTGNLPGHHIDVIVEHIAPALRPLPPQHPEHMAIVANMLQSKRLVQEQSSVIAQAVADGQIQVFGGVYNLTTRRVRFA